MAKKLSRTKPSVDDARLVGFKALVSCYWRMRVVLESELSMDGPTRRTVFVCERNSVIRESE